jgi:uncharacterized protein YecT (DUF1311 family)
MILAILPILLLHPGNHSEGEAQWNCDNPQVQQEMNYCAAKEFHAADEALNAQWEITSAEMKACDARWTGPEDGRPGYFASLLEAQRAWIAFRDAHCRSEAYAFRGGSMEPLINATCRTALTELRIEQLRELVDTQ